MNYMVIFWIYTQCVIQKRCGPQLCIVPKPVTKLVNYFGQLFFLVKFIIAKQIKLDTCVSSYKVDTADA